MKKDIGSGNDGRIFAIIPARGGSKGVPRKNVKLLAGYPLIAYSIAAAKMCKSISRVIVSTDSAEIAEISQKFGAEVPFIRPAELSTDSSPDIEFVLHAAKWFEENEGGIPEYFVHLRPTTPLRDPGIMEEAIAMIIGQPQSTSLRSAHEASESPFKWFSMDKDGYFTSITPQYSNEDLNRPRQQFPKVYIPDGYVDIVKPSLVKKSGVLHGDRMAGFISPFCQEVDVPEDFDRLEYEIQKGKFMVHEYLKANYKGAQK